MQPIFNPCEESVVLNSRPPCARLKVTVALATLVLLLAAQAKEPLPSEKRPGAGAGRLREGSKLVSVPGRMELIGDRTTFTPAEGGDSFRLLENLALERIGQILSDSRDKSQWEVSGVVTEYRGSNYLLVTKAIIKSGVGAPASSSSSTSASRADR